MIGWRPQLRSVCLLILLLAAAGLAVSGLTSCEKRPAATQNDSADASATEEPTELADGSYSCDATNTTRGNGPYSLDCEKSGDTITIHFSNGGHIDLDIDSQEHSGEGSWEITATHSETGDEWSLTIDE